MANKQNQKMKVREIPSKIKIIREIKKEEEESAESQNEEPLEEIISDAPSSRAFPQFEAAQPSTIREREFPSTPSSAPNGGEEKKETPAFIYKPAGITEQEIQKKYSVRPASFNQPRAMEANAGIFRQPRENAFISRGMEPGQEQEKDKYSVELETERAPERKKHIWEV